MPDQPDRVARARLRRALAGLDGEDQLAVRSAGILARRLVRAPLGARQAAREWKARGTVLVTGGTGALAGHVARFLAGRGAGHLLLASRRGPAAPGAAELAEELGRLGARVTVARCDVADKQALAALLAGIPPEQPLTAVVHTAGIAGLDDPAGTDLAHFADVMAAKVTGASNLDELTSHLPLDAFVLFSSNAGVWGSGGQAAYSAANAYLDALAAHRRGRGLPGTSLAWGAWGGLGMLDDPARREYLDRRGVRSMAPELAILALAQALDHDETFAAIADMDWERFAASFTAVRPSPLIGELGVPDGQDAGPDDDQAESPLARRLADAPPGRRGQVLLEAVRAEAAAVLGLTGTDEVEPNRAFREMGFDSLTAVELRNKLARAAAVRLPATLVFDYPTPAALTRHLETVLCPQSAPAVPRDVESARPSGALTAERLRSATADELFDLIDSELGIAYPGSHDHGT